MDLVLSSGFLAFGAHAGFLAAVEDLDLPVHGVCGTSSGALLGALWASGMPAREVLAEVSARPPLRWARPSARFWRGAFALDPVLAELRARLPARFEDLPRPFGVGVGTPSGHALVTTGPLPEAVAASCAIPWVFAPVQVGEHLAYDGGVLDRTALRAWRALRPDAEVVLHLIERSHGAAAEPSVEGATVVRSPRSGASLWALGDVQAAFERARAAAREVLAGEAPVAG